MALLQGWTLALLAAVFGLCLESHTALGKCNGQWAIHACGGGNGKRSPIDDLSELRRPALAGYEDVASPEVQGDLSPLDPAPADYGLLQPVGGGSGADLRRLQDDRLSSRGARQRAQDRELYDADLKKQLFWRALMKRFRNLEEDRRR